MRHPLSGELAQSEFPLNDLFHCVLRLMKLLRNYPCRSKGNPLHEIAESLTQDLERQPASIVFHIQCIFLASLTQYKHE
jgi:hypothetical protein